MDFKVLQYNTHLFNGTVVAGFPNTVYEDDTRLQGIISQLKSLQADFVTLEEVWGTKSSTQIINDLATSPFIFYATDDIDSPLKMGSGLLLLSAHPLKSGQFNKPVVNVPRFTEFEKTAMPDGLANKGFITVQANPVNGPKFWIIHTHTQADYDKASIDARTDNLRQIAERVDLIHKEFGEPVIVVGDLNVVGENEDGTPTAEYSGMKTRFDAVGLTDSYRALHPTAASDPGYTYDGTRNLLIGIFASGDKGTRQRLDYLFADVKHGMKAGNAAVVSDFTYEDSATGKATDLSDHYPISIGFSVR